jgi:hypothetical protein
LNNIAEYSTITNILDMLDIESFFSKTNYVDYYPVVYDTISNRFVKTINEPDKIQILSYQDSQKAYISSYVNDFDLFFNKVFDRNQNELYLETDSPAVKNSKDVLYKNRMVDIIPFKIAFFKNIVNIKRFKGGLQYIEFIVDLYVRMKYGNQLYTNNNEFNDVQNSGLLNVGGRYKIYEGIYNNYVSGNVFTAIESSIIDGYSVIPQFILNVQKIDKNVYQLASIINIEEWETILKPIVHPLGWNVVFSQLGLLSNATALVQHKKTIINTRKDRYINIGYETTNSTVRDINKNSFYLSEIGNITFRDLFNTNYSGVKSGYYNTYFVIKKYVRKKYV